jgi:uncharacterized integral membrane protein
MLRIPETSNLGIFVAGAVVAGHGISFIVTYVKIGVHSPFHSLGTAGSLSVVKAARNVKLTTHLYLAPWSRKHRVYLHSAQEEHSSSDYSKRNSCTRHSEVQ